VVVVVALFAANALAWQPGSAPQSGKTPDVRRIVQGLGTGPEALIAIRAKDNSIVSGYLAEAGSDSLVVVDPQSGRRTSVALAEISRLEGHNLVSGAEVHQGRGLRSKIVRGLQRVMPIQPAHQNNLRKGPLIVAGIAVLVAIILIVKLT
jgi:hypothetical protein